MTYAGIPRGTTRFLAAIARHNDRAWFAEHREEYEAFYVEAAQELVVALGAKLHEVRPRIHAEPRIDRSIKRINRDTRFAADKRPYKDHLSLWFWEGSDKNWSPGVWFDLGAKTLGLGIGMHAFAPPVLVRYRERVVDGRSGSELARIVTKLRSAGYELGGKVRKRVPPGFDPEHERAELLKHDGLYAWIMRPLPREAYSARFPAFCAAHFRRLAPLHAWLVAIA